MENEIVALITANGISSAVFMPSDDAKYGSVFDCQNAGELVAV